MWSSGFRSTEGGGNATHVDVAIGSIGGTGLIVAATEDGACVLDKQYNFSIPAEATQVFSFNGEMMHSHHANQALDFGDQGFKVWSAALGRRMVVRYF